MHSPTFLRQPGRRVLDALIARGMAFDAPTLEFPDTPMPILPGLDPQTDALLCQLPFPDGST